MKDPNAQAMAKRRYDSLTPEKRSEIARLAANARWAKRAKALSTGESGEGA